MIIIKFVKIYDKYEINKNGVIKNINTNKELKVAKKNEKLMCWLTIDGKSKHVNVTALLEELTNEFVEVVEPIQEVVQATKKKGRKGKAYRVTMLDGEVLEFTGNKEAMEYFKAKYPSITYRKDYFWYFVRNRMSKPMTNLEIKQVEYM